MTNFNFHTKVEGSTFCNSQKIISELKQGEVLSVVPEPENKFDNNAIAVYHKEIRIGYIPKETAAKIVKDVTIGKVSCVVSEVTGGSGGKENYGCNIVLNIERSETPIQNLGV